MFRVQSADDEVTGERRSMASSNVRGVDVSGLLLHNATLKDGVLVVSDHATATSMSPVVLQLSPLSTRPRPSATHFLYRCPVHIGDTVSEISFPCDDSAKCHRHNVHLSCAKLQ